MKYRIATLVAVAAIVLSVFAASARANTAYGVVYCGPGGAYATVHIHNENTGAYGGTTASGTGSFAFGGINPAYTYDYWATKNGYTSNVVRLPGWSQQVIGLCL